MRLAEKNIHHVTVHCADGIPYSWFVSLNSMRVSDSRNYVNYENGKTCIKEYKIEDLPKCVQSFISKHDAVEREWERYENYKGYEVVTSFVYK